MPLYPGESFISLFYKPKLQSLALVQSTLHTVSLLQHLNEQLGVVLVQEGREVDGVKPPALQPVNFSGINSHGLLRTYVRRILHM